ncbi:solute carrier family 66 member 2-like isoform X3 [Homarus americanus]|uniref:solute carrier family 66 member 2-like isoform X3 n=1 Tax=Homarus americanus TaxID=6706 RepID=UPI001C457BF0|nr:solute carrier family 66 member 2-like isoform X3 [Homarus americanus]
MTLTPIKSIMSEEGWLDTLTWGLSGTSALAMMVGGVVPYIPQYLEIKRTENPEGFSLYVCLVLLIANTLRILFWFGHWFELPLLFQSIIMNIAMMMIISLCVSIRNKGQLVHGKEHVFTGFVSVLTEAMLAVPQFYKNFVSKSTFGMSRQMVLMWLMGDTFKTIYFFLRSAPLQFFICGCLQIFIDIAVLGQCFIYRKKNSHLIN